MSTDTTIIDFFVSLFSFLTSQLTNIANFFTQSELGRLILGIGVFYILVSVVLTVVNKVKR